MKTYTEQEVDFGLKIADILPLNQWLQENKINKNYVGEKYEFWIFQDLNHRIVKQDVKNYVITCDLVPERLNFEIENGIITKQYNG